LAEATEGGTELVLTGVSTDCCVLSTALAAADAGAHVRVVADACAGLSEADHQRALATMALYRPFLEIVTVADVLAEAAR
jgi:nicotinamidase-related amidase